MKKSAALIATSIAYFASSASALALQVTPPTGVGISGSTAPSTILSAALNIAYITAVILVLFFLVLGAFRWITSGGDKEGIASARKTIINALIGLAILALALVIVTLVGKILNIDITGSFNIRNLQGTPTDI